MPYLNVVEVESALTSGGLPYAGSRAGSRCAPHDGRVERRIAMRIGNGSGLLAPAFMRTWRPACTRMGRSTSSSSCSSEVAKAYKTGTGITLAAISARRLPLLVVSFDLTVFPRPTRTAATTA